jgi:fucose 4-O-acetylase-like acetyltransferase
MERAKERLWYIDNLRLLMIVFVVMHHLAVTYSGFGSFYDLGQAGHLSVPSTIWFGFYLSLQQGYFMGLLFMIAGYFAAGSYDRKGFGPFVRERFRRLVIPSLIFMAVITPFIMYVELGRNYFQPQLGLLHVLLRFLAGTGPMWFAVALFIFSAVYGLGRMITRKGAPVSNRKQIKPSFINAVMLILIIAVCAFLIRIVQPIGTNVLNMQFCYFASYIVLFIVGILVHRNNLFARISYHAGKRWLIWGIALGFISWVAVMKAGGAPAGMTALNGGFAWQSAAFSVWESFVAVAVSIGLVAVFREKCNSRNKLARALSDSSFTVYMFHPPIIIAVVLLFSPVAFGPVVKWTLLCAICVPLCFAAAHYVFRRIPFLNKVL